MENLSLITLAVMAVTGSSLSAQAIIPSPTDVPSAEILATCTATAGARWDQMTVTGRAGRTRDELINTCAINSDVSAYAASQNQAITDQQKQQTAAIAAQQAAVAKYQRDKVAWGAAVQKQKDDYAAVYTQWQADAAACEDGDVSKCASQ